MTRLVVFDLDETLWSLPHGYCALMEPPFEREGDRVRDSGGLELNLRPDARSTLDSLASRGLLVSVASRSTPETAGEILRLLDLLDRFTCPCFEWQDKDLSLQRILSEVERDAGLRLSPGEVLLVDDWPSNIYDAARVGVPGLVFGRDIHSLAEILDHLDYQGERHAV